jgi:hypothetical protein
MTKKDYSNLDKTFNDEQSDVEDRFGKTFDAVYGDRPARVKNKAVRISISLSADDVNFVSYLRGHIADPINNFYPTISDIYRAGINSLRNLEKASGNSSKQEIAKLIKGI